MTPEERAQAVVTDYYAKQCWGYLPNQRAEYEQLLAAAIRAAEADMRERCAKVASDLAEEYGILHMALCQNVAEELANDIRALRESTE